jgi:hypothetical protein
MKPPTLVVSDPPHDEVDVEAAAKLLDLDVFAARLKTGFGAPEVFGASGPDSAVKLAVALRKTGLRVTILQGSALAGLPWPNPASHLAFDESCLRLTVDGSGLEIPWTTEMLGVFCQPPEGFSFEKPTDLDRAIASHHGPTISEALQSRSFIDLYLLEEGASVRRVSIVPRMFGMEGEKLAAELERRFAALRMDRRLQGVRPRTRYVEHGSQAAGRRGPDAPRRRGFSYGTRQLADVLGSISGELRTMTQYELGSRIAYGLHPLGEVV